MTTLPQVSSVRLPRAGGQPAPAHLQAASAASGTQMNAADVWRVIRGNLWLIITLLVVMAAVGYVSNLLLERTYPRWTSTGIMQVSTAMPYDPLKQPVPLTDNMALPTEQKTQARLLTDEGLINEVLSKSDTIRQTGWFKSLAGANGADIEAVKKDIENHFEVSPIQDTSLIKVGMTCSDPKDARTIAEEIGSMHIQQQRQLKADLQARRSQMLSDLRDRINLRLNDISRESNSLVVSLNVDGFGMPGRVSAKELELSDLLKRQLDVEDLVGKAQSTADGFEQSLKNGETPIAIEDLLSRDPSISLMRQQRDSIDMQAAAYGASMGSENSRVQQIQKQQEVMSQKLEEAEAAARAKYAAMLVSSAKEEAASSRHTLEAIQNRVKAIKDELGKMNADLARYLTLKDEEKGLRDTLQDVDKQLDTISQIRNQQDLTSITWAHHPEIPGRMSFPKLWLTMTVAIFLGLALSLGIAFAREALDTTIRSPRDLTRVGQLNLLGIVPDEQDDPQATGGRLPLIIFDAPNSLMAEQLRQVRTRLQHAASLDTTRSIMVTSPSPGDGKTTMAANLAAGLALNGRKILLVDANFRRPGLHKVFSIAPGSGFAEALASAEKFPAGVRETQIPNLSVMTTGNRPQNPTELLESQLLNDFIERALKDFDHVIFDSGPLLLASDTMALAPRVDGVVSVVRAQINTRGLLQRMRDTLRQIKAEHIGVVLNGVRAQGGGYYASNIKTFYAYQNGVSAA